MFPLNYETTFEINTTPLAVATYSAVAAGISGVDVSSNDELDQTKYLDGNGYATTDVIGGQLTYSFTGHRFIGDAAQDFIFLKQLSFGSARKTDFKITDSAGNVISGDCTIANVTGPGGEAGGKGDISFEIHINGAPTYTPAP